MLVNHRSTLRMRVEKGEVCWSDIDFEVKPQMNLLFANWAAKLMVHNVYSDKIVSTDIGRALNL